MDKVQKKKNLSFSKVKQMSKKVEEKMEHIILDGQFKGEKVTFQPIFDDVTIEELLLEFAHLLNEADEKDIKISESMSIYLIQLLSIKHFTHFKNDIPDVLIADGKCVGLFDALDFFRKTGLMNECIENMFLPQELNKVFSKYTDFASKGLFAEKLNDEVIMKFRKLKDNNQDIFKVLENINTEK